MDGLFVPNISFGEPVLKFVKRSAGVPVDTHLMIDDPIRYIDNYASLGSDLITFHVEAAENPREVIDRIHQNGVKAGISVKPATPLSAIEEFIDTVDMILIMTVNPGFGGQSFITETVEKISQARKLIEKSGRNIYLQVDGGINGKTAKICREAGADVLVSGSYIFSAEDKPTAISSLR
jgi:ribulose-phosphate 3-epimerase